MSENSLNPMYTSSQVESAIIRAGLPDMEMAHGAGTVANPEAYRRLLIDGEPIRTQPIASVTALSLSHDGEVSYRTAVFGVEDPAFIAQVDRMGSSWITTLAEQASKYNRAAGLLLGKNGLELDYSIYRDGIYCTLGGCVITMSINKENGDAELKSRPFVSASVLNATEKQIKNPVVKATSALASAIPKFRALRGMNTEDQARVVAIQNMKAFAAVSKKRSDPIVVGRPLIARV